MARNLFKDMASIVALLVNSSKKTSGTMRRCAIVCDDLRLALVRASAQVGAYCRVGSREPDFGLFPGQGEVGVRLGVELGQVVIRRLVWSEFGIAQVL